MQQLEHDRRRRPSAARCASRAASAPPALLPATASRVVSMPSSVPLSADPSAPSPHRRALRVTDVRARGGSRPRSTVHRPRWASSTHCRWSVSRLPRTKAPDGNRSPPAPVTGRRGRCAQELTAGRARLLDVDARGVECGCRCRAGAGSANHGRRGARRPTGRCATLRDDAAPGRAAASRHRHRLPAALRRVPTVGSAMASRRRVESVVGRA